MRTRRLEWLVIGPVLAGCGSVDVKGEEDGSPSPQADAGSGSEADSGTGTEADADSPATVVLRYDFDDGLLDDGGARFVPDVSGADRRGLVVGSAGGDALIELVERDEADGQAIQFPGRCEEADPMDCPRVMVEAEDSIDQDPGESDFAVSVDVLVPSNPTGPDAIDQNVMQKGNFDDPGQWKVEIDTQRRPICVFHYPDDAGSPIIVRVDRSIDDGGWHSLRCERIGNQLRLLLDDGKGLNMRSVEIPAGHTVDISNPQPIRIGGQNVQASADQFYGSLDNVSVEIF
jgi:Laminin G domain